MRGLLTITALLLATSAMASDLNLPVKAVVPNPGYDWSGFYAGLNVGGAWGSNSSTLKSFQGIPTDIPAGSEPLSGFAGGAYLGANYQLSALVLGVEGNFDALGVQGQGPCLAVLSCSDKATWESDIAARVGFANGPVLVYAKGGLAFAHFEHTVSLPNVFTTSASETPMGPLVGAGIEYAITQHLAARIEYDFASFEDKTLDLHVSGIGNGGLNSVDYRKDLSILKAGVSYKF